MTSLPCMLELIRFIYPQNCQASFGDYKHCIELGLPADAEDEADPPRGDDDAPTLGP